MPETHKTKSVQKGGFSKTQVQLDFTRTTFGIKVVVLSVTLLAVWLFNSLFLWTSFLCFLSHMVRSDCLATGNQPPFPGESIIGPFWVRCRSLGQSAVQCQALGACREGAQAGLLLGLN